VRQLFFGGNAVIVLGYPRGVDSSWIPARGPASNVTARATAPRTGRVAAVRTNVPKFGAVFLGRLRVGDRTVYEAVVPEDYLGFSGVDLAHEGREMRRVPAFTVEEGQEVTAEIGYAGYVFPGYGCEYNYTLSLEWLYEDELWLSRDNKERP
jgi:hypothetical protein